MADYQTYQTYKLNDAFTTIHPPPLCAILLLQICGTCVNGLLYPFTHVIACFVGSRGWFAYFDGAYIGLHIGLAMFLVVVDGLNPCSWSTSLETSQKMTLLSVHKNTFVKDALNIMLIYLLHYYNSSAHNAYIDPSIPCPKLFDTYRLNRSKYFHKYESHLICNWLIVSYYYVSKTSLILFDDWIKKFLDLFSFLGQECSKFITFVCLMCIRMTSKSAYIEIRMLN